MGKIKVIEIIADSSLSGAPKHLLTLISRINKSLFLIILICPRGWLSKQAKELGIKVINIKMSEFFDYNSVLRLRRKIFKINPNVVHLHGIRAGWLGVLAAAKIKNRLVYTEHLYTKDYHLDSWVREQIQLQGLSYILKNVRTIIAPSRAVKVFLTSKFRIQSKKIIVVYNGLENVNLSFRRTERREISGGLSSRHGGARDDLKVGFIGSLNHQKGVDLLLKAMGKVIKIFPKIKLEIIGDGPLKEKLKAKAGIYNQNIHFLGAKSDIWRYLAKWRMLIIPSRSESFGQTAIEAAIMSKPVVANNIGGLPEVIIDQKTGILVKTSDIDSLARAIIYLLNNPCKADKIGKKARIRYERLFTAKKMADKIEEVYKRAVINNKSNYVLEIKL